MHTTSTNTHSLHEVLHRIAHLLPTQGPIDVFIHHNTLHAFDHLPFEQAVEEAAIVYGAQPYLTEQRYLEEYQHGRITDADLDAVIKKEAIEESNYWGIPVRVVIRHILLTAPSVESFQQVKWLLRESPHLTKVPNVEINILLSWLNKHLERSSKLYTLNYEAAQGLTDLIEALPQNSQIKNSERLLLWAAALLAVAQKWDMSKQAPQSILLEVDEEMINPLIIRFAEEYLDLGFSDQLLPGREAGMLRTFLCLIERAHYAVPKWLEPLIFEIALYKQSSDAVQLIASLLSDFRIPEEAQYDFLLKEALSLKGWAGYVALAEAHPDILHAQENEIKPTLAEFLAIRLILKKYAQRSARYRAKLSETPQASPELRAIDSTYCLAYHLLHTIGQLGKASEFLQDDNGSQRLVDLLLNFDETRRRRIWHRAYEHHFYTRSLNALVHHHQQPACHPSAQFLFCIDDREESIRRHLENQNNTYQTFGTAGFFGVDANYTQLNGSSSPHCPIIITPKHAVREIPKQGAQKKLSRFQKKQRTWFKIAGYINRGSGSYLHSAILSLVGCLSFIPMVFGVIAPRGLQFMSKLFGGEGTTPAELAELKIDVDELSEADLPGYTLDEMADRVVAVLRGVGLVTNFSNLIILIGHGSSSRNNPLKSAYECGACGGRPGRMNPRAFSMMANQGSVRALIASRHGIIIPDQTYFIGAFHNTCSDIIEYFDLDKSPVQYSDLIKQIKDDLTIATKQNALERCRRFAQARVKNTDQAAQEALARSLMLSEARPEYNHATNALCIVGPRDLTTGLFLDRRSFLVSYDATIDSDSTILLGLLRAVVPVCGGINLEYLFSSIDNEVYGAGTKLPHNIVSLLGIMNGTSSDLRTGLPAQMVEIHEPVRLLVIVVASQNQVNEVLNRDASIKRAFDGEWLKLVVWNKDLNLLEWRLPSGAYEKFAPSDEELTQIHQYRDWFMGKSDHLEFAEISTSERNI
jgi:uncharacterized protein